MTLNQKLAIHQAIGTLQGVASVLPSIGIDLNKVSEVLNGLAEMLSAVCDEMGGAE